MISLALFRCNAPMHFEVSDASPFKQCEPCSVRVHSEKETDVQDIFKRVDTITVSLASMLASTLSFFFMSS